MTVAATLDACPTCQTVYEVVRQHVRPPADPVCETCQQALPVADGNDWLTYQLIRSKPKLYQGLVQYAKVKAFCSALAARSNTSSGISDVRTCSSNSSKSAITCPFSALYVTKYCDSTSAGCDLRHSTKRATPSRASRRPGPSRFVPQAANVSR